MNFLVLLSFFSALLMGLAFLLIGRLLLRLRHTRVQIRKSTANNETPQPEEQTNRADTPATATVTSSHTNEWQSYTINIQWGDSLTILAYILTVIGIITIISSIAGFMITINT